MTTDQWIGLLILGVSVGYLFGWGFLNFIYEVWR